MYLEIFTNHFLQFTLIVLCISFLSTVICFVIEYLWVGKQKSSLQKLLDKRLDYSYRQDAIIWILDVFGIWSIFGKVFTLGVTYYIAMKLSAVLGSFSYLKNFFLNGSVYFHVLIIILATDLIGYWLHRKFHESKTFWFLHKFHHSANDMNILTSRRDNPLVVPFFVLFTGLPVAVLGFPAAYPSMILLSIFTLHSSLIHSQLSSNWRFIGKWIIVSPYGHKVHHSFNKDHFNKNYSFAFPIWDHIFGTYYSGTEKVVRVGLGVRNDKGLLNEIMNDSKIFWTRIKDSIMENQGFYLLVFSSFCLIVIFDIYFNEIKKLLRSNKDLFNTIKDLYLQIQ